MIEAVNWCTSCFLGVMSPRTRRGRVVWVCDRCGCVGGFE
jgi:hypothetical protein